MQEAWRQVRQSDQDIANIPLPEECGQNKEDNESIAQNIKRRFVRVFGKLFHQSLTEKFKEREKKMSKEARKKEDDEKLEEYFDITDILDYLIDTDADRTEIQCLIKRELAYIKAPLRYDKAEQMLWTFAEHAQRLLKNTREDKGERI